MPMQPFNEKKPSSLSSQILKALAKVSSERDFQGDALGTGGREPFTSFYDSTRNIAACITWMIRPTLLPICRISSL